MEYTMDDYVKSIVYDIRGEYVEKILNFRRQTYYAIYRIATNKDEYVMKLYNDEHKGDIEEKALYYLRKASYIKVPKVYNIYEKNENIPYSAIIMEKISDGKILTKVPKKIQHRVVKDVIDNIIFKENDYDLGSFGEIGKEKYSTWQEYYKKRAKEDTEKAKSLLINKRININTYLDVQDKYFNFDTIFREPIERATLVHGNCSIDNIFFNEDGEAVALINPHIAMYGDKEYETISLDKRKNNGLDILAEYKRRIPLSSNYEEKYEFYYLYDLIERNYSILKSEIDKEKMSRKEKKIIKKYKYE